jgi:hypothetical protein
MRRTRLAYHLLLAGTISAALAGCSHTVVVPGDRVLRVALSEYRVIPQSILARPGQLTLIVENDGRLTHNLAVASGARVLGQTPPIPPGQSADLFLTVSAGSYLMSSTLFSDQALGTYGTLNVKP